MDDARNVKEVHSQSRTGDDGMDIQWASGTETPFVVDTVGSDDRSWLDTAGHPHSVDMRVQERYTRVDHDTLELTVTVDDPKMYTKPFVAVTNRFKWIPNQEDDEQLCVPSEMIDYIKIIAVPADQDKATGKK